MDYNFLFHRRPIMTFQSNAIWSARDRSPYRIESLGGRETHPLTNTTKLVTQSSHTLSPFSILHLHSPFSILSTFRPAFLAQSLSSRLFPYNSYHILPLLPTDLLLRSSRLAKPSTEHSVQGQVWLLLTHCPPSP